MFFSESNLKNIFADNLNNACSWLKIIQCDQKMYNLDAARSLEVITALTLGPLWGCIQNLNAMPGNQLYRWWSGKVLLKIFWRRCGRRVTLHVCVYWCVCVLSYVRLFGIPWTVARQASLSMEFLRQEYWSGLPSPPPGYSPVPGIKPTFLASPALQVDSLPLCPSHRDTAYIMANAKAIPFEHLSSARISSLNIILLSPLLLPLPYLCLGSPSQHKLPSMVSKNSVLALNLPIPLKKRKAQ